MAWKQVKTPEEILRDADRRKESSTWIIFLEEYVIFKLIIWFIEWVGVLRFFFLASLICAILAYGYAHMTLAVVLLIISLAFAIGMFVDSDEPDHFR